MKRGTKATLFVASLLLVPSVAAPLMAGCAGGPTKASTGEYIDDAAVSAKVKAKLFQDPDVSGFAVQVETFKGQVQLSGFVNTPQQELKAEELARSVAGVRSVSNDLIVKSASGA